MYTKYNYIYKSKSMYTKYNYIYMSVYTNLPK